MQDFTEIERALNVDGGPKTEFMRRRSVVGLISL